MKNRIIVLTVAMLLMWTTAFAQTTITSIDAREGTIIVRGTTDSEVITYEVYSSELQPSGLTSTDIVGFGEKYFESENFTISFGLNRSGNYIVRLFDGEEWETTDPFEFLDSGERGAFAEVISGILSIADTAEARAAAAAAIDTEFSKASNAVLMKSIGINSYGDRSKPVKDAICKKMVEDGANKTLDEKALLTLYKDSEAIARMNLDGAKSASEILDERNYVFEDVAHKDIETSSRKTWIEQAVAKNAPYKAVAEIEEMYEKASALYVINNAKITNIESKVKGYAALLEIEDVSEYKSYLSKVSTTVNRKLVEELDNKEAVTVDRLLEALKTAATATSGGLGGGGGAGGGGYSSVSGAKPTTNSNYVVNGTTNEEVGEENAETVTALFSDIADSHWAYDAIASLKGSGVIAGYGDGSFKPDNTITREEYVKMIIVAFDLEDEKASSHFHDVFDSDWFYPYVSAAFEKGIVLGDNLGIFGVHSNITRQDAAVIAARVMRTAGISADVQREYKGFNDESAIADYAAEDIKTLYCAGKINGTDLGNFEPQRFCTRAEAAAMIYGISR